MYTCYMVLEKNSQLINAICKVQIRSTDPVVNLPALAPIYHTPSQIKYSISSARTSHGNLHKKTLRISYPGLSQTDFSKFDELIKGVYQVMVRLENNEVYELASTQFPMTCSSRFNIETGHELIFEVSSPLSIKYIGLDDSGITGKPGLLEEQFDYDFDFNLA